MVESLAYKSDGNTVLASTTRSYQANRDLLASVENVVQGTPNVTVSKYAYELDPLGRRTSVVQTGTAFGQDHLWKWSYNDRSELTLDTPRPAGRDRSRCDHGKAVAASQG